MPRDTDKPLVAIEPDVYLDRGAVRVRVSEAYAQRIAAAGGEPLILAPGATDIARLTSMVHAFVFTGGDDPRTEPFGEPTDPRVTPIHPLRQQFAVGALEHLRDHAPSTPVLGVCLGMQLMALVARGAIAQHMPESHPDTHANHWDNDHQIIPEPGVDLAPGVSHSRHRQCITDPGALRVIARAPDGVIEAIDDPTRAHYVGVQWHPERTDDPNLGQRLFDQLIAAVRR